jgi:tetratricopeptide (TPR) repeat protein
MRTCANCERVVEEGANFCANCGASLRAPAMEAMIEDARRALRQNPADADAHYNLALAYRMTGPEELALREFAVVAELQPDFADPHYEIAALHARAGRREQAVAAVQRALQVEPGHRQAKKLLEKLA